MATDAVYCVIPAPCLAHNAAMLAAKEYMELHPERRVHVIA
ncbi:MAG: hypothetical protein ACLT74_07830 [Christensenellales bacterium]